MTKTTREFDELVEACARTGTDYADLCGEPGWMREQIDAHHDTAKASGARICFSSGFNSIPFDLGVLMLQKEAVAKFGKPAPRVKGRVRAMAGTFSGGTAASLTETMKSIAKNPRLIPILQSPFGLTPGFEGPDQPMGLIPEYDATLDKWAAPCWRNERLQHPPILPRSYPMNVAPLPGYTQPRQYQHAMLQPRSSKSGPRSQHTGIT